MYRSPVMSCPYLTVALVSLTLFVMASCARPMHGARHATSCAQPSADDVHPFDSSATASFKGQYRITLVSDWEEEAGRAVTGTLALQSTDTLHQFYERGIMGQWRRSGNRVAWGWADIVPGKVTLPWSADPAARDPEHPGVLLHSTGRLELGVWRGLDGSSTTLMVRTVGPLGFAGTWNSDLGVAVIDKDGRQLANPHGHFCAESEQ